MRTVSFFFGIALFAINFYGQVGIGTTNPSAASMLEVSSSSDGGLTYKGFMPPRVPNVVTRKSLNPTAADAGLLIFLSSSGCVQMWTGLEWENVKCSENYVVPLTLLGMQNFEFIPYVPNLPFIEIEAGTYETIVGPHPNEPRYASPSRGYGVSNGQATIEFGPIDASIYTFVAIRFRLASFSTIPSQGADVGDTVILSVSVDGVTYFDEIRITGYNDKKWGFSNLDMVTSTYKGNGDFTTFQPINILEKGIGKVELKNIPVSSNIFFQIKIKNDRSDEIWVIDDVEIYGR